MMKKMIVMIAFVAGIGTIAQAQTRQHKSPQQRAEMLSKKLNLTADQSAKLNAIFAAQKVSMDSLKAANSGDKKQAFGAVWQNTDKQVNAILTADQQKAYAELKANRKQHAKGEFKTGRKQLAPEQKAEMITKRLQQKLNLSQDQSAKVSSILLAQANRIDSLKANKAQGDRKQNHQAFKSIKQNTDAQLSAVLNADQKKVYDELKAARKDRMKGKRDAAGHKAG